jgi:hypothetical protein
MNSLAPIVVFPYKRLQHIQQTIEALKSNALAAESHLYIYSDGAKTLQDEEEVNAVRRYLKSISGFKKIEITEQKSNVGLSTSIHKGITEIVNKYGKVIVLEDDIVTSKYFLQFMNDALEFYKNDERVACISGYIYPVKGQLPNNFFIEGTETWGWGTWKRTWDLFEPDGKKILQQLKEKKLISKMDFDGAYPYSEMLESQSQKEVPAWDILLYSQMVLLHKLTLFPGKPLVQNIGHDNSGTHCKQSTIYEVELYQQPVKVEKIEVKESKKGHRLFEDFYRRNFNPTLWQRIQRRLKLS